MQAESRENRSGEKRRRVSTSVRHCDGVTEEGSFREGDLLVGKRSLPSGITYEGSFDDGRLANGTMTIPSLLTFKGSFENGLPKRGILTTDKFTANGLFDESGSLVEGDLLESDRTFQSGHFGKCLATLSGVRLLYGINTTGDGYASIGEHHDDGSPEKATVYYPDDHVEIGEFKERELHRGTIIDEDGTVNVGKFASNDEIADTSDSESCLSKGVRVSNDGTVTAFRKQKRKWTVYPDGQYERDINDGSAKLTVLPNSKILSGETVDGVFTGAVFDALTGFNV